jgi:hypothetical protein
MYRNDLTGSTFSAVRHMPRGGRVLMTVARRATFAA